MPSATTPTARSPSCRDFVTAEPLLPIQIGSHNSKLKTVLKLNSPPTKSPPAAVIAGAGNRPPSATRSESIPDREQKATLSAEPADDERFRCLSVRNRF